MEFYKVNPNTILGSSNNSNHQEHLPDNNTADDQQHLSNYDHTCRTKEKQSECFRLRSVLIPVLLGQILAVMIGLTAMCSSLLAKANISLPIAQNMLHYLLLTVCYGSVTLYRHFKHNQSQPTQPSENFPISASMTSGKGIRQPILRLVVLYTFAGLLDVHANWAIVSAYVLTTVTSVQLLDCVTIPASMFFSFLFLRHRFRWIHYLAMVICLLGAGGMVATDVWVNPTVVKNDTNITTDTVNTFNPSSIALGDFLVIIGAVAYAASNVLQQYLVSRYGFLNFLTFAGLSGFIFTLIYALTIERSTIYETFWNPKVDQLLVWGCLSGYVAAMFILYSLMPYVLVRTNAVLVNLSLLTADVYALLMGIYMFQNRFHFLYLLLFVIILFGVALFSLKQPSVLPQSLDWRRSLCCKPKEEERTVHTTSGSI